MRQDGHHSRPPSISRAEIGERDPLLPGTRRQVVYKREATYRHDREEQQSRRPPITQPDDSAKELEDRAEEQERLRALRRAIRRREEEEKEKRERGRAEGEERRNLEQAESERRRREQKGETVVSAAIRELLKNPRYSVLGSGIRLRKPTSPETDPVKKLQLPSKQSQKLSRTPLIPTAEVLANWQDTLGTNAKPESSKRTTASMKLQKPLSREDTEKTFEPPRHPQSKPISPILPPQTDGVLADDRPLEAQRVQADIDEYDTSMRLKSSTLPSKPSPITLSLPALSNDPTPGLEHDSGDSGTSHPTKPAEGSKGAEGLANISQPEHMKQAESPSSPSDTSTEIATCAARDDIHGVQATIGPTKDLVLLSKPSKSKVPDISNVVDFPPTPDRPISRLGSSSDSSAGDAGEDEHSFVQVNGASDEASEEGEVSVESALDTAMSVVKGLLLRELLNYALPEATDAVEESGPSRSGSNAGSAGSSASSSLSSRTPNSQTLQRRKRARGSGRDPGDGDSDGSEDDDRPKKKNEKGSPDQLPHRRLKCPFYQRQPEKYTKAACRGEGFTDMAKLKDHIKRVHTQPLRCSRCWLEMKSDDAYTEHIQQEDICKKKAEPQEDRIRPQMLKRLDFKKAPYANARNVEEKWNMLFSVLFPNDANIPSPYEQQGMSPRLEQALSEALEEELTRELAPILEPIMSRIKKLIPTIIEKCRLKLMRTSPPSDDETIFTPSAVSSGVGGSDSEPGSSKKQAKHRGSPTASRCSGSSFEVVPTPEVLSSKTQGKRPQRPTPSTSDTSVEGRQEVSSPGSSTDFSMYYPDAPIEMPNPDWSGIGDSFDMGDDSGFFAPPGAFPSNGIPPTAEGCSAASADTGRIAFGSHFAEGLAQQSNAYLCSSQLPAWPLPEAEWDSWSGAHGQPGGEQPGDTINLERELFSKWDFTTKDADFSHFSNR